MKLQRKSSKLHNAILNGAMLVFVAVLMILVITLVRAKLLQNTQNLGMALVQTYAVEEEMTINYLEQELMMIGLYVNNVLDAGGNTDDVQLWMNDHFSKFIEISGSGLIDFYAVIDGQIVAATPWEGDSTYQYSNAEWYRQAIEANGDIVYDDVYTDAITGERIFTISMALSSPGDVVAMDVYVQNPTLHNTSHSLPEECSYYLCDSDGILLYSVTKWDNAPEQLQSYADYMMAGIKDGSLLAYDAFFQDEDGISRGVYYQTMPNGWTVIITMPIRSILMGEPSTMVYIIAALALVVFLVLLFMTIQDILRSRSAKKADDTAHMLGDSFYAIYRINFVNGTYECFKTSSTLQGILPERGDYAIFLEAMRPLVKPSTYQAFESSFSLESIRTRTAQDIPDYGGDYQRLFDDTYRWVNIRSLYNRDLFPDEVILCFRDVDEEKRRDLQHTIILQDALEAAQKSTKAKTDFFSRMSHDMRTPLNAIIGSCALAEKSHAAGDGDKAWSYIKKIDFAANQLLSLINDILELSKTEAGKARLDQKELDLRQLLLNISDIFRDRMQDEGKYFEVHIDFHDSIVIGDEKKLIQVVNNLLSNAVKYSEHGDTIRLDARQFDFQQYSKFQIVVEDTGIGMSPAFLEHLFDPYSRETTFSPHATVGTGLGMAIVKSLVQQMSGEISVESTLGEGSRFTITIPLQTVHVSKQPDEPAAPEHPAFDYTGRTILVAEDNALNREILTELLQQMGANVLTAVNGKEAVHAFLGTPVYSIDAILMDMQMPEMDGCEAAAAIRASSRPDAADIPIIAATANAFAEDITRTTQAGMNDHISKPIDSAVLQQTLQKLITVWDAVRQTRSNTENGGM